MTEKIVILGAEETEVVITREGPVHHVRQGEREDAIEVIAIREGEAELRVNGKRVLVSFVNDGNTIYFNYGGSTFRAEVTGREVRRRARHREYSLGAPMPSVVLKISVDVGDVVTRGTPLVVLEAMKMEHQITAPWDGTVTAIHCSPGELVQPGIDLVEITAAEGQ